MDNSLLPRLIGDVRFSIASLGAVWLSLFVPIVLLIGGILLIGGGLREVATVLFAAALFSAADMFGLLLRIGDDADDEDDRLEALLQLDAWSMTKALLARYF